MQTFHDITVTGSAEQPRSFQQPLPSQQSLTVDLNGGEERSMEGDWHAYRMACDQADHVLSLTAAEKLEYKRRYANAYLGARALAHGGVSPKNRPRVLSPDLIASLARQNATRRYSQYPWLQRLITLIEEIEQIQETFCDSRNIFHLPQSKLQ